MVDWFGPLSLDPSLSVLPPQSMASPQIAASQSDAAKKEPQFVPSDQLKQFMMGKFDEPQIPSGIPSQEQQQQAFTHRAIGNATGDVVANLQNAANILRPGAGNQAMGDSSRKYGEMLAQRALGDAAARRQEAIQNTQLGDLSDQRRINQFKMAQELMQQQMMKDPTSELSRQAQAKEMSRLDALGSMTQDPNKRAILEQRKKMIAGVPASLLAGAEQNDPLVEGIKLESQERQAGAKQAGDNENHQSEAERRKAETALGYERLAEEKRWHDEDKTLKEDSKNKLQLNEDKKAEEDIANLRNAKAELDKHIENLRSEKVSNDKPNVYGNETANFISSFGIPGVSIKSNPQLQSMLTSIPLAQATAEKAVTGSSRYTPQRWTQFAVQPGEGTQKSINKLAGGSEYLDELIKERMTQLHTNAAGAPTSQSAMAKAFPPGAIPNTAAQVQARTQTGASPAPGAIRTTKDGRKMQQQPDGKWKEL